MLERKVHLMTATPHIPLACCPPIRGSNVLERLRKDFNVHDAHSTKIAPVPPEMADRFLAGERKLWSDAVKSPGVVVD